MSATILVIACAHAHVPRPAHVTAAWQLPQPTLHKSASRLRGGAESSLRPRPAMMSIPKPQRSTTELLLPNVPLLFAVLAATYRALAGPDSVAWALLAATWAIDGAAFHTNAFFRLRELGLPVPSWVPLDRIGSVILPLALLSICALWLWIMILRHATWQWVGFVAAAAVYVASELVPALRGDFWQSGPRHGHLLFTHTAFLLFELSLWSLY